eukprot:scaffold620_cov386-Prasinococcus_capsulatus_cf.AAC.19
MPACHHPLTWTYLATMRAACALGSLVGPQMFPHRATAESALRCHAQSGPLSSVQARLQRGRDAYKL